MERFACIIILYKPSKSIIDKWRIIIEDQKEFGNFIIVDNTPKEEFENNTTHQIDFGIYFELRQNLGIAEAQNIGIKKAIELGLNYIFFFDQDSKIPPLYFRNMIKSYMCIQEKIKTPLILGPKHISINQNVDYKVRLLKSIDNFSFVDSILSSGSLLNRDVINRVGLMMASLFIDQVDHEYCYRAATKNIPTIVNNDIILYHQIGKKVINLLGANFIISTPFRYYYQFRNSIVLLKLDYVKKRIKGKILVRKTIDFFIQPLINYPNTITILKYMIKGFKDGIKYKVR